MGLFARFRDVEDQFFGLGQATVAGGGSKWAELLVKAVLRAKGPIFVYRLNAAASEMTVQSAPIVFLTGAGAYIYINNLRQPDKGPARTSRFDELDVVIRRKNGKVTAGIPQLGLFAKGDDIHAATAALDAKKKAFVADLEEAGELDMLEIEDRPALTHRVATIRPAGDLGQFALKAVIVVFCVVAAFVTSSVLIASKVEQSINNVKSIKIGGSQFWTRMEDELDRMARPGSDLPEATKQKLLADICAIAAKWRPFVVEIQSALADPNNPPRPAGTSANK